MGNIEVEKAICVDNRFWIESFSRLVRLIGLMSLCLMVRCLLGLLADKSETAYQRNTVSSHNV